MQRVERPPTVPRAGGVVVARATPAQPLIPRQLCLLSSLLRAQVVPTRKEIHLSLTDIARKVLCFRYWGEEAPR